MADKKGLIDGAGVVNGLFLANYWGFANSPWFGCKVCLVKLLLALLPNKPGVWLLVYLFYSKSPLVFVDELPSEDDFYSGIVVITGLNLLLLLFPNNPPVGVELSWSLLLLFDEKRLFEGGVTTV